MPRAIVAEKRVPTLGRRSAPFFAALCVLVFAGCGAGSTIGGSSPGTSPTAVSTTPSPAAPTPTASPPATGVPTPSPTPLAIGADSVFASIGTGIEIFSQTGATTDTFASSTGADYFGLDDSGNAYVLADQSDFTITIARYAIGESAPNATYAPTSARPQFILVGRNGTLVAAGAASDASNNATAIYDIWDPGVTGAPSRTITYADESEVVLSGTVAANGTAYLPYNDSSGQVRYDVIPPGTATPSRTIVESIAPANSTFAPNVMAVDSDGTLYVGEWTYESPDANAGLYVYPASGPETMIKTGAPNPTGIDFDSTGNVYVANSNATIQPDSALGSDTEHVLSKFAADAASLVSQVSSGIDDPQNLAVDLNGTAYMADFANADQTSGSIVSVAPSATVAGTFVANINADNLVLFDGTNVRSIRTHGVSRATGSRALRLGALRRQRGLRRP